MIMLTIKIYKIKRLNKQKKTVTLMRKKTSVTKEKYPFNFNAFFLEATMIIFKNLWFFSLSEDKSKLVSFLCSDIRQNVLTNNSLSIHTETGDIFCNDFNTEENFYSFLLVQQGELKQLIQNESLIIIALKNAHVPTSHHFL